MPAGRKPTPNETALKHQFGPELLERMGAAVRPHVRGFTRDAFVNLALEIEQLEMKARVNRLSDELRRLIPGDFPAALAVLLKSAQSGKLDGFDLWPFTHFIQTHGLAHPDISLEALKELTKQFTAEWAVRPFILRHPQKTMAFLLQCAGDDHVAVRRWASEGSRPRLPWGERLQGFIRDPAPTLRILERLKHDSERFVQTSVANHLNDIAKDHPDLVVSILQRWKDKPGGSRAGNVEWIARRALRSLIKNGHAGALAHIGVSRNARIAVSGLEIRRKKLRLGDRLEFSFGIRSLSTKPQKLVLDYIIHFVKTNGRTTPKVFKLRTFSLAAGETRAFQRSHHLKRVTTRTYYSGTHALQLQVNGTAGVQLHWALDV